MAQQQPPTGAQPVRALMLNQGIASDVGVKGMPRAEAAFSAGLDDRIDPSFVRLREFTWTERIFKRRVPALGAADAGPLRWHLARARAGREAVEAAIRRGNVDVAHLTTHVQGLLLGRLADQLPTVLSVDVTIAQWQRLLRRRPPGSRPPADMLPALALEKRAFERAAAVQAWTGEVARQIRSSAPAARVVTLHPGIDLDLFRPGDGERPPGPLRVLFVGGRFVDKGGPDLLAALEPWLGEDVELHVVSRSEVPPRQGVVTHRLEAASPPLLQLFRDADVFALPSYSDAVPWVVLEAMASATPVVASDVGSIPELLGYGAAGLAVPPGDVAALREAVSFLLFDEEARRSTGAAARHRCEQHYDLRLQGRRLADLLVDIATP